MGISFYRVAPPPPPTISAAGLAFKCREGHPLLRTLSTDGRKSHSGVTKGPADPAVRGGGGGGGGGGAILGGRQIVV